MKKHKVLFVCHGNICRSPMAEAILKYLLTKDRVIGQFEIDSAATSTEAIGEDVYYKAQDTLNKHGIKNFHHISRQFTLRDYEYFDEILVMDENNYRNIMKMCDNDPIHKVKKFGTKDIADPWYTGDFETTFSEIDKACDVLKFHLLGGKEVFPK